VGRELLRRGHEVRLAVPPNLVGFAEAAGLAAVAYGLDSRALSEAQRDYWTCFFRNPWRIGELDRLGRKIGELVTQCWKQEVTTTLTSLADGTDLLIAGMGFEQFAANVAEYYDLPLATLHFAPMRANGQALPFLPAPLGRSAMTAWERLSWSGVVKEVEDAQRRELGLPKATCPWPQRIAERGSLEIQAYDEVCFPGLAAEWAKWDGRRPSARPFVGALTVEWPTDADDEVASWIAAGKPPIYFGFGSIAVGSAADTITMIGAVSAQLGERALVCTGGTDYSDLRHFEHVKVVGAVNHAAIFPTCRAVVHHGGAGTTAASLRAGVPQMILWALCDQPFFGAAVKRLKVGTARRFSTTTEKSLIADLHRILEPQYLARAREIATRMTKPAESVRAAVDLVENLVRPRRVSGQRNATGKSVTSAATVSVITISLHDLDGLKRTVDSVRALRYEGRVEHIVIDGGSGDDVVEYLSGCEPGFTYWQSEPDGGRYDAMNQGIAHASGDLLWFMHSGDRFSDPDAVTEVVKEISRHGPARDVWGYGMADLVSGLDDRSLGLPPWGEMPFNIRKFLTGRAVVPHQAAFFGSSLVNKLGGYDLDLGIFADQEFMFRAARLREPITIRRTVCEFDTSGVGSTRPLGEHFRDLRRMWDLHAHYPLGGRRTSLAYLRVIEFRRRAAQEIFVWGLSVFRSERNDHLRQFMRADRTSDPDFSR